MARRRRRRGGGPSLWRVVVILTPFIVIAVLITQFVLSNKGQYWMAQNLWRGDSERVVKVVNKVLVESSEGLGLPSPHATLSFGDSLGNVPDFDRIVLSVSEDEEGRVLEGRARAFSAVNLAPSISTISANAQISGDLRELGLELVTGKQNKDQSVHLLFDAGDKTDVLLHLVPAELYGLDSLVVLEDEKEPVPIKARIALVINRFGRDREVSARCEKLPGEYTVAIYSELEDARVWADRARAKGMEVILNLPMEPKGFPNPDPGPNAILVDMSGRRIRSLYKQALKKVGPVEGIKTFYGSLAVEDPDVMRVVLEETKRADLFFFDTT
ncbi:MAG: divergent polysaccharide deacetylase family protein, partial [Candidatus Eisenbacteria bacterium]|nr:divergent polysaccharide deacetylase family protein [Candidatus Eisenbacteria bacterium]